VKAGRRLVSAAEARKKGSMGADRRQFLKQSLGISCATLIASRLGATATPASAAAAGADLAARMAWMNPPAASKQSGGELVVHSRAKTDFWRKTFYGYVTDNGHFLHLSVSGGFTFQARVNGKYAALYDQAGLMVRLDAKNWMKCGTEFFDGRRHASVVFTRDFSDWSTMPDLSDTAAVWWRAARKKDAIECSCSLDGKAFTTVRQGYFPANVKVESGIMCAAPEGAGFDAVFDDLSLTA
jgi:uncharacterized protein